MSEKYRMLYVEDKKTWWDAVKPVVEKDCEITFCESIKEALVAIKSGKKFDLAAVDLSLVDYGAEWEIKNSEDLIEFLKEQGIGVTAISGVTESMIGRLEKKLGVKVLSKGQDGVAGEIVRAALEGYSSLDK